MTVCRFDKDSWRDFSPEELQLIEKERADKGEKLKELLLKFPIEKFQYGKICPACTKPNNKDTEFCTGCSFPLTADDLEKLPDNVFMDIITGVNQDTEILYQDEDIVLFNDKFGVSVHGEHIDIIPRVVINDVTELTRDHLPMIQQLYAVGLNHLKTRGFCQRYNVHPDELEHWITAGYNYPVSVKHLHLHMVLPPFKHEKVFQYPRFHGHKKIVSDLQRFGRVIVYEEEPNDVEGEELYGHAMKNHRTLLERQTNE